MSLWLWAAFLALIGLFLAVDLGVFHRRAHAAGFREALAWTGVWIAAALGFNVGVYFLYEWHIAGVGLVDGRPVLDGGRAALQFLTGYLVEKSLSLDNIVVIALIFGAFGVPRELQHRVLFWGIVGAVVLRGVMILAGVALIHRFEWILYIFGGLLLLTAARMLFATHGSFDPAQSRIVRFVRRFCHVSTGYDGQRFFTRIGGRFAVTPLLLVLVVIEAADVMFAVDSIPAIFAITRDPFLVFTSNIFAILGLRALYFVLAEALPRFRFLKISLVLLLAFIGVKLLLVNAWPIPTGASLAVIAGLLMAGIGASLAVSAKCPPQHVQT